MASSSFQDLVSQIVQDVPPIEDRVKLFHQALEHESHFDELPSLPNALKWDWDQDEVAHSEDFSRDIIKSLRDTDGAAWRELLDSCTPNQAEMLESFVNGHQIKDIFEPFDFGSTRGTRQELGAMERAEPVKLFSSRPEHKENLLEKLEDLFSSHHRKAELGIYDDAGRKDPVLAYVDTAFYNWGRTVDNNPRYTCIPKTRHGVQQIVKYAGMNGLGVRVSGYRHSWSPLFGRKNDGILISTLDLHTATAIPNTASLDAVSTFLWGSAPTELNMIVPLKKVEKTDKSALVRVGCATTNEQMRTWCIQNKYLTLPLNVIMVEITFGGSNAPICHGAGRKHRTLSDLVEAIEYVDAHGEYRVIEKGDENFLLAASGCFGLIGVITHLTLRLEPMTYAVMKPLKVDAIDAIPPPPGMDRKLIPAGLYQDRTADQIAKAQADFELRAAESYYAEWFWFPYSNQIWINTWDDTNDESGVVEFPSKLQVATQWLEAIAMEAAQNVAKDTRTADCGPMLQTSLVSRLAMAALPAGETIKTWLPDALHFRRAIQNTRVRDMELEIPLPPHPDNKERPDFKVVQQAWWSAILKTYEYSQTCPMRMPLEMRIMGDSGVVMAPQLGNTLGTCSIEVLTLESCADIWLPFAQDVLNEWMKLRDYEGQKLNIRPHWAKEWFPFTVDGKPFLEYLKTTAYKEEIVKFKEILGRIGEKHGWTLADVKKMFSNDMLDDLYSL